MHIDEKKNHWKRIEIGFKVLEIVLLVFGLLAASIFGFLQWKVDKEQNEITKQLAGADSSLKLSILRINKERYQLYFEGKSEGATDSYKFVDRNWDGEKFPCTDFRQKLYPQSGNS